MNKLNFVGEEPSLHPKLLHELLDFDKEELRIKSMTIVSNGSKIIEKIVRENPNILGISWEFCKPETSIKIGRAANEGRQCRDVEKSCLLGSWRLKFRLQLSDFRILQLDFAL